MSWAQHVHMNIEEVRRVIPRSEQLYALAVSALLETANGSLVLARRSHEVELHPGCWHVSAGGYVDLLKAQKSRSLFHTIFAEIAEETNVLPQNLQFVEQLFLCRALHPASSLVEACFYSRTNLSDRETLSRAAKAADRHEGAIHIFSMKEVRDLLDAEPFVPSGRAILRFMIDRRTPE